MQDTTSGFGASGLDAPEGARSGLDEALDAPEDPLGDPGPGERSGLSSRIAEELLDGLPEDLAGAGAGPVTAAPDLARAVEIDDPSRAVGDDPARPIHGSFAEEFERS
ncbi:hypothetical protein [Rathayibacter sp. VKM Ac-2630]|uniref:hypothetical protein n=1 Tax=Rathayibacter sp. VKM Ac-2630 TaxID=1938617 RepID=UPI0011158DFC|nr:hypothetical protein [Rathayibacter sp. VKM Ac-2630]